MVHKFHIKRPAIVTVVSMVMPLLFIVGGLAYEGHLNGGIQEMTDEYWTRAILVTLFVFAVTATILYWWASVRYEVSQHGISIFFGPFRQGIQWPSLRKVELYHLPFSKEPFAVAVHFTLLALPHRKLLMVDDLQELHSCIVQAWQEYKEIKQ